MSKNNDQDRSIQDYLAKNKQSEVGNEKLDKKQIALEIDAYTKMSRYFENDKIKTARSQRKIAFILTGVFCVLCIVAVLIAFTTLSMKKVEAFVVRVDNTTGYADIVKVASENELTQGEVLDKYWLSVFVRNWESYDWETIQNMSDTVELMSTPQLFQRYTNYMVNDKKNSPMYLLKDTKSLVVQIKSVTFIETYGKKLAQVRFTRYVRNIDGTTDGQYIPSSWIATITYDYKKTLYTEGERRINPLGFQARSYNVASEKVVSQ